MCKLSVNIVQNVYNSLQSSFLSLAWPWPGRSLPKGKPMGVMGPSTGALAWPWWCRSLPNGNQWKCWDPGLGPNVVRLLVHLPPQCPLNALMPLIAPLCPSTPPWASNGPYATYTLLVPEYLHFMEAPQCTPTPPDAPNGPSPLGTPNAPYATYTLLAPENLHSLPAPNRPVTPPNSPNTP